MNESFQCEKQQRVAMNGSKSICFNIEQGVPQGNVPHFTIFKYMISRKSLMINAQGYNAQMMQPMLEF